MGGCCRIIATAASLSWLLVSTASVLLIVYSLFSSKLVLGPQQYIYQDGEIVASSVPSVGIVSRCLRVEGRRPCALFILDGLATDPEVFPTLWKAAFIFFCLGLSVMVATCLLAAFSICVQIAFGKSIFTITGTVQAAAGVILILGVLLYVGGWGSTRMLRLCGPDVHPYYLGECTLGWASYTGIMGILLTFLSAGLSVKAEKSTSTDKVRHRVEKGQHLVCLL